VNSGDEKLKGVRGWLLLFCFSLTVLDPVAVIVNLFTAADAAKPYFAQDPGLMRLVLANGVAGIALSVFSLYAGISLWKRLPGAPAVARKYLLTVLAYSVLAPFLPHLLGPTKLGGSRESFALVSINSLFTILYVGAWYLYLDRSRRVRATYGENR
jgi:hypothetical protein